MQHYIYDGSGERVLKANSDMEAVYENGELVNTPGTVSINGYTSYPSAFIVITADGVYSKHYYAGTQRIVSRLGDNDASIFENGCINCKQEATENSFDDQKLKQAQIQDLNLLAEKAKKGKITLKEYKPIPLEEQEKAMAEDANRPFAPPSGAGGLYYYHPDHLGTSTALTDFNGNAYQFFLNLPFGETMAQQLGSNYYNSPFKFNGKELDEETGFYYYGARYYDPKISLWLTVDPLAEKFPNFNPYNYVMQNPLNLTDPTGMEPEEGGEGDPPKQINVIAIANYINKPNDQAMDNALIAAKKTDAIVFTFNDFNDFKAKMKANVQEGTVANLTLIEHGGYGASGLEFGSDYLFTPSQMKELGGAISPYLNKDVSPTLMVLACNFGAGKNPEKSIVKIQTLADASGATVIAPKTKGLTYQNMFNTDGGMTFYPILKTALKGKDAQSQPNANKYLGKWIMMIPEGNNWNMELNQNDVFFDKKGNIRTNR